MDWFKANDIAFEFHDYKNQGMAVEKLNGWCKQVSWETLFNKRSSTWKDLNTTAPLTVNDAKAAIKIMAIHHSIIKRPVIEQDGKIIAVGFNAAMLQDLLK